MGDQDEKRYSLVGPFMVEASGNPYLAHYRCWLASDPDKKVCFEGTSRELGNYFEVVILKLTDEARAALGKSEQR
jgi:hypothetical protein